MGQRSLNGSVKTVRGVPGDGQAIGVTQPEHESASTPAFLRGIRNSVTPPTAECQDVPRKLQQQALNWGASLPGTENLTTEVSSGLGWEVPSRRESLICPRVNETTIASAWRVTDPDRLVERSPPGQMTDNGLGDRTTEEGMLVLSRKASQGIRIPDLGITFRVLKASRGDVLIGIDAPGAVRVLREELIDHGSAAATSDREQMPGDRLSTAAILSDQINSKLRSIEIGLSMLVSELEDCN